MVTWIHTSAQTGKPNAPIDKKTAERLPTRGQQHFGPGAGEGSKPMPVVEELVEMVLDFRGQEHKDWTTSDFIRNKLADLGIQIKDTPDGTEWEM